MTDGGLLPGDDGEPWEDPSAAVPAEAPAAVLGKPPPELLALQQMEAALARAELDNPDVVWHEDVLRVRYVLGFARLTSFEPGAALRGGPGGRPEVDLGDQLAALREQVAETLEGPLRGEADPREQLRAAAAALPQLVQAGSEARAGVLRGHANELSEEELDAEAGRRVLVSVSGGGGGAGFVYIGAWERLERAGIVPGFVMGASIGSLWYPSKKASTNCRRPCSSMTSGPSAFFTPRQ
jgi:AcrR family transcriptional regulator